MYYPPNVNSIFNPEIVCMQTIFKKPDYFNCEIYGKETLSVSLGQKKDELSLVSHLSDLLPSYHCQQKSRQNIECTVSSCILG
jgi:hypothetical protein